MSQRVASGGANLHARLLGVVFDYRRPSGAEGLALLPTPGSTQDCGWGLLRPLQAVEKLPWCLFSSQIEHQIRPFWDVLSPIRARDQLDADFFNTPGPSTKLASVALRYLV